MEPIALEAERLKVAGERARLPWRASSPPWSRERQTGIERADA